MLTISVSVIRPNVNLEIDSKKPDLNTTKLTNVTYIQYSIEKRIIVDTDVSFILSKGTLILLTSFFMLISPQ